MLIAVKYRVEFSHQLLVLLAIAQSLAIFEVLHSALGWAGSHWFLTSTQVASRFFSVALLWWLPVPFLFDLGVYSGFLFITIAWGVTEIVRSAYYIARLMKWPTRLLTLFRYNLFIILYPMGLIGELMVMFRLMEWRHFNFDAAGWALVGVGLIYAILFPKMYGHMLSQRKKKRGTL
jgi:very-long-chain (3R)-3-hydroxyacyl-CoA dehydratase